MYCANLKLLVPNSIFEPRVILFVSQDISETARLKYKIGPMVRITFIDALIYLSLDTYCCLSF